MTMRIYWPRLPLRTRAKLKVVRAIDGAGIWLCDRGHEDAAIALWRLCGLWRP